MKVTTQTKEALQHNISDSSALLKPLNQAGRNSVSVRVDTVIHACRDDNVQFSKSNNFVKLQPL